MSLSIAIDRVLVACDGLLSTDRRHNVGRHRPGGSKMLSASLAGQLAPRVAAVPSELVHDFRAPVVNEPY